MTDRTTWWVRSMVKGVVVAEPRECRFCGVALRDDDDDYHDTCVEAPPDPGRPRRSPTHPMYGPRGYAILNNA